MLRQHFRHRAFVVGARDVIESREVYESFEATTAAAEDVMATAVRLADAEDLAVMAVGRLGSGEFDLLSDADVLFVCGEKGDRIALTKAAEQMMHALVGLHPGRDRVSRGRAFAAARRRRRTAGPLPRSWRRISSTRPRPGKR